MVLCLERWLLYNNTPVYLVHTQTWRHETCISSVRWSPAPSPAKCVHTVHGETGQRFRQCNNGMKGIILIQGLFENHFYLYISELLVESLSKVRTVLHCGNLVGLKDWNNKNCVCDKCTNVYYTGKILSVDICMRDAECAFPGYLSSVEQTANWTHHACSARTEHLQNPSVI